MGRSGGGGSRGGGFSHSSHSSGSRSHSSHSGGSSFRSSSGPSNRHVSTSGFSSSRPSSGYRPPMGGGYRPPPPPPPPPPRPRYYGHSHHVYHHHTGPYRRTSTSAVVSVIIFLIILAVIVSAFSSIGGSGNVPKSTVNRERLHGGSFISDCVTDNLGWLRSEGSSESKVGGSLEYFWRQTGIQPYVILLEYDPSFRSSSARFEYADLLYDKYVGREDAILVVYFDDEPDGNWEIVKGLQAGAVMDDEATEIFWAYCDQYWYSNASTPSAIEGMFKSTADRIMQQATNGWDVMKTVVIFAIVAAGIVGIIAVMMVRRKHEAERAQETVDILQAGQNQQTYGTSSDPSMDDLTSKYDDSPQ